MSMAQMTREEFRKKYAYRLSGMILYMQASDVKAEGVLARTQRIFDMPGEIDQMLSAMYDDLVRPPKPAPPQALPPQPGVNGPRK